MEIIDTLSLEVILERVMVSGNLFSSDTDICYCTSAFYSAMITVKVVVYFYLGRRFLIRVGEMKGGGVE